MHIASVLVFTFFLKRKASKASNSVRPIHSLPGPGFCAGLRRARKIGGHLSGRVTCVPPKRGETSQLALIFIPWIDRKLIWNKMVDMKVLWFFIQSIDMQDLLFHCSRFLMRKPLATILPGHSETAQHQSYTSYTSIFLINNRYASINVWSKLLVLGDSKWPFDPLVGGHSTP